MTTTTSNTTTTDDQAPPAASAPALNRPEEIVTRPDGVTVRRVPMYSLYERIWHWSQTLFVIVLLFTGAVIRFPDALSPLVFETAVTAHNIFAVLLILNAFLGLFFFVTTGLIQQYMIDRHGFVGGVFKQALYYLFGIFKGATHPFRRRASKRLNPLQRLSYLMLLNVLIPLQIISGLLLYFAHELSPIVDGIGGLPVLAEIHSLVAWLFMTFIFVHVYLTTTGDTVLEHLRTMVAGYEEHVVDPGDDTGADVAQDAGPEASPDAAPSPTAAYNPVGTPFSPERR